MAKLFFFVFVFLSLSLLLIHNLPLSSADFEGFDDSDDSTDSPDSDFPLPAATTTTTLLTSLSDPGPPNSPDPILRHSNPSSSPDHPKPSSTSFEYWDEDEFEGLPLQHHHHQQQQTPPEHPITTDNATDQETPKAKPYLVKGPVSYSVEIACTAFLIIFLVNYFTGKKENENLALAWAEKFATKDSIFDKNFSLLGFGEGDDSPLLLKEGQSVFKFYASGRRFCQGMLATMELKSRHDLISRLWNLVVPCKDEIKFEVYMDEEAMDNVVFALGRKKLVKGMHKEERDLSRFASLVVPPNGRKWVGEEFAVLSESKEVAGDLITEAVLDQVFGEKAFEKYGKGFISMHFSDQYPGSHKKILMFKFAIPNANHMADMTRLVALVPYYIDLIGRYKLSSQARSKTEAARNKLAQEVYRELQFARQEELQQKKADRQNKLSAEALRKREAKKRARQLRKAMPKVKISRAR